MKYSENDIETLFAEICDKISNGKSLRKCLEDNEISPKTFYCWIKDDVKSERYARAKELRSEFIFEEIIEISDHSESDHTAFTGANVVQRDRLRIDARKWVLSKMNPKKYGDKSEVDLTSGGEKISQETTVTFINARKKDEL